MTVRQVPENVMLWLVAQGYCVISVTSDTKTKTELFDVTREWR